MLRKLQTTFSDRATRFYGCYYRVITVCILDFFKHKEFTDKENTTIVKEIIEEGFTTDKLNVLHPDDVGNTILRKIGKGDYEFVFIGGYNPFWTTPYYFSNSARSKWLQPNCMMLQWKQVRSSGQRDHYTTNDYDPDPTVKIAGYKPVGHRLFAIVKRED